MPGIESQRCGAAVLCSTIELSGNFHGWTDKSLSWATASPESSVTPPKHAAELPLGLEMKFDPIEVVRM